MTDLGLENVAGAVGVVVGITAAGVALDSLKGLNKKKKNSKKSRSSLSRTIGF